MKRTGLLLFAFAAMVIAFSGCSKDDDDNGFNIVGTWNIDKVEVYMGDMLIDTDVDDGTVTFNADGTGSATDSDGTDTFNWSLSGNQLTISDDEETTVMTLTTMEKNLMVAEFNETFEDINFNVVMTLTR